MDDNDEKKNILDIDDYDKTPINDDYSQTINQKLSSSFTKNNILDIFNLEGPCKIYISLREFFYNASTVRLSHKLYAIFFSILLTPLIYWYSRVRFSVYHSMHEQYINIDTINSYLVGYPQINTAEYWSLLSYHFLVTSFSNLSVCYLPVIILMKFEFSKIPKMFYITIVISFILNFIMVLVFFHLYSIGIELHTVGSAIPFFIIALLGAIIGANSVKDHLKLKYFPYAIGLIYALFSGILIVYLKLIPRLFYSQDSDMIKIIFRLFLHPILFEFMFFSFRFIFFWSNMYENESCIRRISCFLYSPYIINNLFGRFLVLSLDSIYNTIILSIFLGIEEVFFRMTILSRDNNIISHIFGHERTSKVVFSQGYIRLKSDLTNLDMISEDFGILVTPVIFYFLNFSQSGKLGEAPLSITVLLLSTSLQFIISTITDFTPLFIACITNSRVLNNINLWAVIHKKNNKIMENKEKYIQDSKYGIILPLKEWSYVDKLLILLRRNQFDQINAHHTSFKFKQLSLFICFLGMSFYFLWTYFNTRATFCANIIDGTMLLGICKSL